MAKNKKQQMIRDYVKGYKLKPESIDHIAELEKAQLEVLNSEENW